MKTQAIALAGSLWALAPAAAQDWPTKTVRIVVPFGPGSTPDMVARLIADRLQQKLGQSFVIENKPGASGNLGTDAVARPSPRRHDRHLDRRTARHQHSFVLQAALRPGEGHRADHAVDPEPSALVVNSALGVNSVAELVTLLKREPGKYNFGSIGSGSLSHLAMEAIALRAAQMVHVPIPGAPQAMTAVLRGDVAMACLPAIAVTPQLVSGKVKILAVSTGDAPRCCRRSRP